MMKGARRIGEWTVGSFLGYAWGESDAVILGDYDLPHLVSYVFEGKRRGTDERMLELLEPYSGQRFRLVRWLFGAGWRVPRRGPRMAHGKGL